LLKYACCSSSALHCRFFPAKAPLSALLVLFLSQQCLSSSSPSSPHLLNLTNENVSFSTLSPFFYPYCEVEDCNGQIQVHLSAFVLINYSSRNVFFQTFSNCTRNLNNSRYNLRFKWKISKDLAYYATRIRYISKYRNPR
jgi:hypothetical protein